MLLLMTPEIITKLNDFFDTHDLFKEECEVVYLMVEIRKLLDREHGRDGQFKKIRFYCDWTVHISKDRNLTDIKEIMEELDTNSLSNGNYNPRIFNFFLLSELRKEMSDLFRIHGLHTKLCQDDEHWTRFVKLFIQVLADQPIIKPTKGISSVAFVAGSIGTRSATIEFTDKRPSLYFGVGD